MWNNELPSGNNYTIRLYVQHLGEFRTYATNENETFDSLRQKIIKRVNLILNTNEQYFFKVAFKYYSMLRRGKATYTPMGNELVVDVVRREETEFNGIIAMCFLDMRQECNPFFVRTEYDVSSATAMAVAASAASSSSLTEWVSREYHFTNNMDSKLLNNISLPEALFWEVSDIALVQGKLQKRTINPINKKEIWKEQYYILDNNGRLWTFVGSRSNSNAPIDKDSPLPFSISVNIDSIRAHVAPNLRDAGMFIVFYDDNINDDPVKLTFKAKSSDEARLWVSGFTALTNMAEAMQLQQQQQQQQQRESGNCNNDGATAATGEERVSNIRGERDFEASLLSCSDNDFIFETELSISKSQAEKSEQETRNLVAASSKLDNLLANRYLRGHFKKFLISTCLEENLLFWEYSMDYRLNYDRVVAVMQKSLPALARSLSPAPARPLAPAKLKISASSKSLASIHHSSNSTASSVGDSISNNSSYSTSRSPSQSAAGDAATTAQEGSSLDDPNDINTLNGTLIKWAECILQVFMLHGAPYEVFSCGVDDVNNITSILQQCKSERTAPSKELFTHAQRASLRLIAEQQFSEFAKSAAARRVLLASIHANERSNTGLNLLASVMQSDIEHSVYDIKPKKIKPTTALSSSIAPPEKDFNNSRFSLFRRIVDKAKSPAASASSATATASSPRSQASKEQHERQQSILNRDSAATSWRQQLLRTAAFTDTMQKRLQEEVGIMDQLDQSADAAAAVASASANRPVSKLQSNNSSNNNRISNKRGMVTADIAQGMNSSVKSQNHVAASSRTFIRAMPSSVTPLKWLPDWWWADCIFDNPDVRVKDLFDCLEEDDASSLSLSNTQTTAAAMLGETDESYDESTSESEDGDDFKVDNVKTTGGGAGSSAVAAGQHQMVVAQNIGLNNRMSSRKHQSGRYVSRVIKIPITAPPNSKLSTSPPSSSNGRASKHLSSRHVPLLQRPTWLAADLNLPECEKPLTKLEPKDWTLPKPRRDEAVAAKLPRRKQSLTPLSLLGGSGSGMPVATTAVTKDEKVKALDMNTGHLQLLWLSHHKDIAGKEKSLSVSEYFATPVASSSMGKSRAVSALASRHTSTASNQSTGDEDEKRDNTAATAATAATAVAAVDSIMNNSSSNKNSKSRNNNSLQRGSYRLSVQFEQDALRSSLPAFNREDKIGSEMLQRFTSELRILKLDCMSTQKMAQLRAYQPTAYLNGTGQCAWQERGVGGACNVYGGIGPVVLSSTMRCRYLFTHTRRRANVMSGSSSSSAGMDASLLVNATDGGGGGGGGGGAGGGDDEDSRLSSVSRLSGFRRTSLSGASKGRSPGTGTDVYDQQDQCHHHLQSANANSSSASLLTGNRSLSEEFVLRSTNTTGTIWSRQHVVLTVHLGQPRLMLLDTPSAAAGPTPFSNNQGTSLFSQAALSATIHLTHATQISPAHQWLHAIEIRDVSGAHWQLQPEGLDEEDTRQACKRWLDQLACYCLPSRTRIIHILKMGYLQKRGSFNTAFKSRWFVLTSDHKLRYYKDDGSSAGGDKSALYKGEVDLLAVVKVECNSDPRAGNREIVLTSNGSTGHSSGVSRTWVLRADDAREATEWLTMLSELLAVRHIATSAAVIGGGTPHASMHLLSALQEGVGGGGGGDEDDDDDEHVAGGDS